MDEREEKALSAGGTTVPAATGPGLAGIGPMGGGMSVPPDTALMGGGAVGDTGSLNDAGAPGSTDTLNTGTGLDKDAPAPDSTVTSPANSTL